MEDSQNFFGLYRSNVEFILEQLYEGNIDVDRSFELLNQLYASYISNSKLANTGKNKEL